MHSTQYAYATAKAKLETLLKLRDEALAKVPFAIDSEEFAEAVDQVLSDLPDSITDAYMELRDAEEAMLTWVHEHMIQLPISQPHLSELQLVFDHRHIMKIRAKLIDSAFHLDVPNV